VIIDLGKVGRHTQISVDNGSKTREILVGTPGSQLIITKDMGNVGRHTWISVDTLIEYMGNNQRHTWISTDNDKRHRKCWKADFRFR